MGTPRYDVAGGLLLLLAGCSMQRLSIPILPPLWPAPQANVLWHEPFDVFSPEQWREVEVRRRTDYRLAALDGRSCLEAQSRNAASILLHAIQFDADTYEWLSWDWRVERAPADEELTKKQGSDAAARVYVYFDVRGLPWQKRSLDYVWSTTQPPGAILESAFSAESKIIVLRGGPGAVGRWHHERRNLEEDYRRCFGRPMPHVIAIGLMTDTDNTRGEALAYYDELRISRVEESEARP